MSEHPDFVQTDLSQVTASYRALRRELIELGDEEMNAFRLPAWPASEHSCGQDGSIRGILWHVSAWKEAVGLALNGAPDVEPHRLRPRDADARSMMEWLGGSHEQLVDVLSRYAANPSLSWPAAPILEGMGLSDTVRVMQEHDRYHAAQIAYLRERWRAGRVNDR